MNKLGWVKQTLLKKGLGFMSRKLDGHKTVIGGVGSILYGLMMIIAALFPETLQGVEGDLDLGINWILGGFVALGIGGKLEKQKQATLLAKEVAHVDAA